MGKIFWAFNRQVEALRESVGHCIQALHSGSAASPLTEKSIAWLSEQGMGDCDPSNSISYLMEFRVLGSLPIPADGPRELLTVANRSNYMQSEDFGKLRSNAGWDELEKFIVTSAFVRLLGAYEQYEIDVLKSLLFYRPLGRTGPNTSDLANEEPTDDVILESPEGDAAYLKPPIWSWMVKSALVKEERRRIFKRAYGIEFKSTKLENTVFDGWYDQRNAIAHGRATVDVRLCDYCDVECYVLKVGRQLKENCLEKYRLDV